tara:strand:- start:32819 stop:33397 length:579 start_codon:yes stop_codon:yes gene_type:complete
MSENHQETLLGASLSRKFAKLPLWLSHPSNIGGFYGFLIAIALILPYRFAGEDNSGWLNDWALHCALLIAACFFLGLCSTLITAISGRFPVTPPRTILYPMPFIGLALLSINRTDIIAIYPFLSWTLILLPGPLYVHLSWAPRWRLLCMIDDGKNPFDGLENVEEEIKDYAKPKSIDSEIESVVDDFETAEE